MNTYAELQNAEVKIKSLTITKLCSVDYNAYTENANPKPCGEATNLRSTGCHIHVSYPHKSQVKSISLVKYMDVFVGIPSVILDAGEDAVKRRELYGKAGCFRLTRYGKLN